MNSAHDAFTHPGTVFYDEPPIEDEPFAGALRPPPPGWTRKTSGDWVGYAPRSYELPDQGWKVHISGTDDVAAGTVDTVWPVAVIHGLAFKVLSSPGRLRRRNSRLAPPESCGKLITIYPRTAGELEAICVELNDRLRGRPGPIVAGDIRWDGGPVYLRYGAFVPQWTTSPAGETVLAVRDGAGRLVPDLRTSSTAAGSGATVPDKLRPYLRRHRPTPSSLHLIHVLRMWNGGGLYRARNTSGRYLVAKEGRAHGGLAADGSDAATRLRREHSVLRRLNGSAIAPTAVELVEDHLRLFLLMEPINGVSLDRAIDRRNPALRCSAVPETTDGYLRWAHSVVANLRHALSLLQDRGFRLPDLDPGQVVVDDEGAVTIVDVGATEEIGEHGATEGTPTAHHDRLLLRIQRHLLLPLTDMCTIAPEKTVEIDVACGERFPDSAIPLRDAPSPRRRPRRADNRPTTTWDVVRAGGWAELRDALARAIVASATPHRKDRLFPGDPAQFKVGPTTLANGAGGVLYAMMQAGCPIPADLEQWFITNAMCPTRNDRSGFYDGIHGTIHVLDRLGHPQSALRLLDGPGLQPPKPESGHDLHGGLAGIALNLIHVATATQERPLLDLAAASGEIIAGRLRHPGNDVPVDRTIGPAGLLRGPSGPALLFLHLYETTGDPAWLDEAGYALLLDLKRLSNNPGTDLTLATGRGTSMVCARYLHHRQDDRLIADHAPIVTARPPWFQQSPGLFAGRAGAIYAAGVAQGGSASHDVVDQIRLLGWHCAGYQDGVAFFGEGLKRLSMDLATGTAGVLIALAAAMTDDDGRLPFLGRPAQPRAELRPFTPLTDHTIGNHQ